MSTQHTRQDHFLVSNNSRQSNSFLMPDHPTGWSFAMAWGVVIANILLIVTGGVVRLTGSGLGCSTWPRCNGDDWTTTPEYGIHGIIEFGNRMLTFVLMMVTIFAFLAIVRTVTPGKGFMDTVKFLFGKDAKAFKGLRSAEYRFSDIYNLNLILLWGIILQAVVGGITVRLKLNPWMVTVHYYLSAIMIVVAAILLNRMYRYFKETIISEQLSLTTSLQSSKTLQIHGWLSAILVAFLIFMGTVTTGTGPHAGDPETHRHAFNPWVVTRMHSFSVWGYCLLIIALFIMIAKYKYPKALRTSALLVLVMILVQAVLGYYQFFNGLPIWIVEAHLTGSGLFTWAAASLIERQITLSNPELRSRALDRIHA